MRLFVDVGNINGQSLLSIACVSRNHEIAAPRLALRSLCQMGWRERTDFLPHHGTTERRHWLRWGATAIHGFSIGRGLRCACERHCPQVSTAGEQICVDVCGYMKLADRGLLCCRNSSVVSHLAQA